MAASIASRLHQRAAETSRIAQWAAGFARLFARVVVFRVDGTTARVDTVLGASAHRVGTHFSLVEQSPLRWAIEAASPVLNNGRCPGAERFFERLQLSPPRAFAVVPLLFDGRIVGLVYADHAQAAMPIGMAAEVLRYCSDILDQSEQRVEPQPAPQPRRRPPPRRRRGRSLRPILGRRTGASAAREQPEERQRQPETATTDLLLVPELAPEPRDLDDLVRPAAPPTELAGAARISSIPWAEATEVCHATDLTAETAKLTQEADALAAADAPVTPEPAAEQPAVQKPAAARPAPRPDVDTAPVRPPYGAKVACQQALQSRQDEPAPRVSDADAIRELPGSEGATSGLDDTTVVAAWAEQAGEPFRSPPHQRPPFFRQSPAPSVATEPDPLPRSATPTAGQGRDAPHRQEQALASPRRGDLRTESDAAPLRQRSRLALPAVEDLRDSGDAPSAPGAPDPLALQPHVVAAPSEPGCVEAEAPASSAPRPAAVFLVTPTGVVPAWADHGADRRGAAQMARAAAQACAGTVGRGGQAVSALLTRLACAVSPRAPTRSAQPAWRHTAAAGIALLLGAGCLVAYQLGPVLERQPGHRLFEVPRNTSATAIAARLQKEGFVRSGRALHWLARLTGVDRELRAGQYRLPGRAWAWTVLRELRAGQIRTEVVTLPEGLTLAEIARTLEATRLGSAATLMAAGRDPALLRKYSIPGPSLEGYLFPETYTLARGLEPAQVVEPMVREFFRRIREVPAMKDLPPRRLFEKVILASLIERETKKPDEMYRIAGVFANRLERNMRLESCATVQYVLGAPKQRLRIADVRTPSPYNTYLHPGLPPGPIGNPGLAALNAAMAPEDHDLLFFFARHDGSDRHVFSHTYAEHRQAQRVHRRPR